MAGLLLLAACGQKVDLAPATGASLPPKAALAPKAATAQELLTPPVQAQPGRSDETLKRSEQRKDDRFDLPPPG